ncbi:unnamed protein product [Cuscuta epithymum]|uniref:Uncharacterized protein n=1 Tax=Cuscuta epithymum TaxID=186058 RepID=A0AAV0G133_9ASTE|nr:unnamed protein product [Cuscuta epithymum]
MSGGRVPLLSRRHGVQVRLGFGRRCVLCFNSVLFCLRFSFELHVVLDVFLFPSKEILVYKSSDEKSVLLVIGSVKLISGSTNSIASTEVIYSKSGSRADGRHKTFYHFVYFFPWIVILIYYIRWI